jgi:hypothetical protein
MTKIQAKYFASVGSLPYAQLRTEFATTLKKGDAFKSRCCLNLLSSCADGEQANRCAAWLMAFDMAATA